MDKTPIEIKLMNDIKFMISLNTVKAKELHKTNKIIKEQKELIKGFVKKIDELQNNISELEYSKSVQDTYYLHHT
jgi:hypothetical protein